MYTQSRPFKRVKGLGVSRLRATGSIPYIFKTSCLLQGTVYLHCQRRCCAWYKTWITWLPLFAVLNMWDCVKFEGPNQRKDDRFALTSDGALLATLRFWQSPSRAQLVRAYACV